MPNCLAQDSAHPPELELLLASPNGRTWLLPRKSRSWRTPWLITQANPLMYIIIFPASKSHFQTPELYLLCSPSIRVIGLVSERFLDDGSEKSFWYKGSQIAFKEQQHISSHNFLKNLITTRKAHFIEGSYALITHASFKY